MQVPVQYLTEDQEILTYALIFVQSHCIFLPLAQVTTMIEEETALRIRDRSFVIQAQEMCTNMPSSSYPPSPVTAHLRIVFS